MPKEFHELLGKTILNFGEIEWITYRMWSALSIEGAPPKEFKRRIDKLLGKFKKIGAPTELQENLVCARKFYDRRNEIAHNPLFAELKSDGTVSYVILIEGKREAFKFETLEELGCDIEKLRSSLWNHAHYFSSEFKE